MIKHYKDILNAELCEWLIDTFENSDKQDIKDDIMNFSQYNFTTDRANVLDGEEKHQEIVDCLQKILKEYLKVYHFYRYL